MTLIDAYVSELNVLLDEARTLLLKAEVTDPFTRDDVLMETNEKLQAAWALYSKLGTQLTRLSDPSLMKTYREIQRGFKEALTNLEEKVKGTKVLEKTTGFTPQRHLIVSRSYGNHENYGNCGSYETERARMDDVERALDVAFARANVAAHTSLDTLALLQGQTETIEHAARGATKTGEALRSGRLTSQRIRLRADKHRFLMDFFLGLDGSLLAVGMLVKLIIRLVRGK